MRPIVQHHKTLKPCGLLWCNQSKSGGQKEPNYNTGRADEEGATVPPLEVRCELAVGCGRRKRKGKARDLSTSAGNTESRRNRIPERWMLRDDRSALGRMRSPLAAGRMQMPPPEVLGG